VVGMKKLQKKNFNIVNNQIVFFVFLMCTISFNQSNPKPGVWFKNTLGEAKTPTEGGEEIISRTIGFMYILDTFKTGDKKVKRGRELMTKDSIITNSGKSLIYMCSTCALASITIITASFFLSRNVHT